MLNEFLSFFISAYHSVVGDDYKHLQWFDSILSVIILSTICISCFIIFIMIFHTCIKMFKR